MTHYRLRTLLIWFLLAVVWGTLIAKVVTDPGPSPAYPQGRGPELAVLGLLVAAITLAVARWTMNARRSILV
jgi:hypothetical protein